MSSRNKDIHAELANTVDQFDHADLGPTFAGVMKVVIGATRTLNDLSGISEAKICRLVAATMLLHAQRLEDGNAGGVLSDDDSIGDCDGSA